MPLWQSLMLTALSGLLLAGALPRLDWGWLAWVGLVPFLRLFPFQRKRAAFGHGILFGLCYLGVMSYWVAVFAAPLIGSPLAILGWTLLSLCEAFFLGFWAVGAQWLRECPNPWAWRLGVPALWAVVEWWRQSGTLGLSWGDLAYTQHLALPILQTTKLTGIWGLAFLIVLVNVALAEMIAPKEPTPALRATPPATGRERVSAIRSYLLPFPLREGWRGTSRGRFFVAVAALVALAFVYGLVTIRAEHLRPTFVAAALQGNINQNVKQDPAYVARMWNTYEGLSQEAAARGAAFTVWPETAYSGYLLTINDERQRVAMQAFQAHQTMVIGSAEWDPLRRKDINSLFLMDARGNVTGRYQKRQLVPFGEYVPGREWFPVLEKLHVTPADMEAGPDTQPLMDGGPGIGKIGAALCFESSYPRLMQEQVARGANLLVVSTDDTWFGRTAEVRQHTAISAVRAAENDRYLIRSAATGVSQIIDPTGKVLAEADVFRPAVVSARVESRTTLTPYARWGDWFIGFCALLLVGVMLLPGGKKEPGPEGPG